MMPSTTLSPHTPHDGDKTRTQSAFFLSPARQVSPATKSSPSSRVVREYSSYPPQSPDSARNHYSKQRHSVPAVSTESDSKLLLPVCPVLALVLLVHSYPENSAKENTISHNRIIASYCDSNQSSDCDTLRKRQYTCILQALV